MSATVVAGSAPATLQFSIPLLILGNLTRGNQEPTNHSGGQTTQLLDDRNGTFLLPAGYIAYPDVGVAYKLDRSWVTWHEARKRCASDGGYLAIIDSQEKLDIMQKISFGHPWIGIHNLYKLHEWSSIHDGSPVSFFKWWPGYPYNIENWHCLFILDSSDEAKHGNQDCEDLRAYLCEIPIKKQPKIEILVKWIP